MSAITDKATQMHLSSKNVWQQLNLVMEVANAARNFHIVHEMKDKGRLKCLSDAPSGKGIPAIVTGSGSSFNAWVPRAKEWKGAIFCSSTQLSTYAMYGRAPDYVIAVDPRAAPGSELSGPEGIFDKTAYVAHLSGPLSYFEQWDATTKGMCYVYRILEPSFEWYTKFLPAIYPWSRVALLPFIDSVASQIQIAARLGYDPIFMIGCDYGGPRLDRYEWVGGEWKKEATSGVLEPGQLHIGPGRIGHGGLITSEQMMYASRGVLIAGAMQMLNEDRKTKIYQMSLPSNIVEFPYAEMNYVLENQNLYRSDWPPAYRKHYVHQIEVRLADSNTYLLPSKGGYGTDYRVFMMVPPNFLGALLDLNKEIIANKVNFAQLEKRFMAVNYDGKNLGILDLQTNPSALQMWMDSPEGKAASEKAKVEGKKIELSPLPIRDQFKAGLLVPQKGELMIHESIELEKWDWHSMAPIDIEEELDKLNRLKRESENIAPIPPFLAVPPQINPLEAAKTENPMIIANQSPSQVEYKIPEQVLVPPSGEQQ